MAEFNGTFDPNDGTPEDLGEYQFESNDQIDDNRDEFELPPWTDPPTGEIPRVLSELNIDEASMKSRLSSIRFSSVFSRADADSSIENHENPFSGIEPSDDQRPMTRREYREQKDAKANKSINSHDDYRMSVSSRVSGGILGPNIGQSQRNVEATSENNEAFFATPEEVVLPEKRLAMAKPKIGKLKPSFLRSDLRSKLVNTAGEGASAFEENEKDLDSPNPVMDIGPRFAPSSFAKRKERIVKGVDASHKRRLPISRIATGVGLGLVVLVAFHFGPATSLAIVSIAIIAATIEFYDTVRRAGFRPAALLGIAAVLSLLLTTYIKGASGVPLVFAFLVIGSMLWYLTGVIRGDPTINISVTFLGVIWIGGLGAFAAAMLRSQAFPQSHGVAYLLGAIVVTVANDTVAYFFGSWFGRHKLAPDISPTKSWEGLIAGSIASILVGGIVVSQISPWTVSDGVILGIVVMVMAPLGDLSESMIKRDLHIKDMGRLLPGHGGMLDRIDGLLFVLPAVYYLLSILKLH